MADQKSYEQHTNTSSHNVKSRFMNREVLGIACLSGASICATIFLVWACVVHGECTHSGPDTCASRRIRSSLPPVPGPPTSPENHEDFVPGFTGNADFYGIGIRVGIYLQWVASLIANTVLNENVRRTTTAPYVGFQIAVLAALLLLIFQSDCTFTAEVIVVLYILLGGIFIVLAPEIVQSFRHARWSNQQKGQYRLFSTFVWILVGLIVPVSAWFWIRLAAARAPNADFNHTPGGTSMFLLARLKGRGIKVASVFMAIWSLLLGLFAFEKITLAFLYKAMEIKLRPLLLILLDIICFVFLTSICLLRAAIDQIVSSSKEDSSRSIAECIHESLALRRDMTMGEMTQSLRSALSIGQQEVCTRMYAFLIAFISIMLSICAVELTLAWNHISDVNSMASTGQIVPFFVGLATLISVMWELLKMVKTTPGVQKQQELSEEAEAYGHEASMWQSSGKAWECC